MICAASGPLPMPAHETHSAHPGPGPGPGSLPGTGVCSQMLTGTPRPGPLTAVTGCCPPVPARQGMAGAGTGPA
jgi:hypothetical protein